jgi:hypothetical protein
MLVVCLLQLCLVECRQTIVGASSVMELIVGFFQLCLTDLCCLLELFLLSGVVPENNSSARFPYCLLYTTLFESWW